MKRRLKKRKKTQRKLLIKSVKTTTTSTSTLSDQNAIPMDPSLISLLNAYGNLMQLELEGESVDNARILDLSTFPHLGLKYLKNGASQVYVLTTQYQNEIAQIRDTYDGRNRLHFQTYEDFCNGKLECDHLVFDPVELCGLLKKNVFEDVSFLRTRCLKESGVVLPGRVEMYGVLVESSRLREYSRVISDDRVGGYDIAQYINVYQCFIHQDIRFSSLPHKKLTNPFKICHLDLNGNDPDTKSFFKQMHTTEDVDVIETGEADAIVYWFSIHYSRDCVVDTSDNASLYKQAACIVKDPVTLTKDGKVKFKFSLKNSCFQIGIVSS